MSNSAMRASGYTVGKVSTKFDRASLNLSRWRTEGQETAGEGNERRRGHARVRVVTIQRSGRVAGLSHAGRQLHRRNPENEEIAGCGGYGQCQAVAAFESTTAHLLPHTAVPLSDYSYLWACPSWSGQSGSTCGTTDEPKMPDSCGETLLPDPDADPASLMPNHTARQHRNRSARALAGCTASRTHRTMSSSPPTTPAK